VPRVGLRDRVGRTAGTSPAELSLTYPRDIGAAELVGEINTKRASTRTACLLQEDWRRGLPLGVAVGDASADGVGEVCGVVCLQTNRCDRLKTPPRMEVSPPSSSVSTSSPGHATGRFLRDSSWAGAGVKQRPDHAPVSVPSLTHGGALNTSVGLSVSWGAVSAVWWVGFRLLGLPSR